MTQSLLPDTALYLPAAHSTQDPPSGPVDPALQALALIVCNPAINTNIRNRIIYEEL